MESLLPASLRLMVVGLNHKTAPLNVRETLAFDAARLAAGLDELKRRFPEAEFVILSTCNRVEVYLARPLRTAPALEELTAFLAEFHRIPPQEFATHLYHHEDRAMVEHLFRVASSLDSMVLGETQILAQVKQAYQAASEHETCGKVFHALFQRALAAAKAVHDETHLAAGHISIASVAVELAQSVFDRFGDKTVLCIGAGEMSTLVMKHLAELKPQRVVVTNRSLGKAEALAAEFGARAAPFEELPRLLLEADIILTGTGATEPIITAGAFKRLLKPRRYRPVVIVDIAVPRDVEEAVGDLSNVYLYNIDDLQRVATSNRDRRDQVARQSLDLLRRHVEEFLAWNAARDVGPVVKALYERAHAHAQGELAGYVAKHPELSEQQQKDLERMLHRVVGKLLHTPVTQLTHQAQAEARPMLASALKKLFRLAEGGDEAEGPAER